MFKKPDNIFKKSGRREKPKDEFDSKLLDLARVTRVTAGGKRFRFRALMIVGDKKGQVGIGVAKGKDVVQAVEKATAQAKKKLIKVLILDDTIPYEVSAKFSSAKVLLKPQQKGRGLVAGGAIRVICQLAGIKNISSKALGKTRNKINNSKATVEALKKLKINQFDKLRINSKSKTVVSDLEKNLSKGNSKDEDN